MATYSRTHYVVLPSYQIRLSLVLIGLLMLGSVLHGLFLYQIANQRIQDGFYAAHNRLRSTWEVLKPAIVATNGASFLLLSGSLLLAVVFISHRLVGPLVKIQGRLHDLARGRLDLPAVRLRQGDEGQPLADQINAMQELYRDRFNRLRELAREIERAPTPVDRDRLRLVLTQCLDGIQLDAPTVGAESSAPPKS